MNHFIKNLQHSSLEVRKRWLFGLSGTSFLIVVALGMLYFNLTLPQNQIIQETSARDIAQKKEKDSSSLFSIFSRGISVFFEDAKGIFQKSTEQINHISSVFTELEKTTSTITTETN